MTIKTKLTTAALGAILATATLQSQAHDEPDYMDLEQTGMQEMVEAMAHAQERLHEALEETRHTSPERRDVFALALENVRDLVERHETDDAMETVEKRVTCKYDVLFAEVYMANEEHRNHLEMESVDAYRDTRDIHLLLARANHLYTNAARCRTGGEPRRIGHRFRSGYGSRAEPEAGHNRVRPDAALLAK